MVVQDNVETFGLQVLLAYLGLLTLAVTHFAVQTVRTRHDPSAIGTPMLLALTGGMVAGSVVSILYALLLWSSLSIILLALGPIGLIVGRNVLRYVYRRPPEKMAWWYAHMGAMFGAGIAFHSAFLVFGSRAVLDLSVLGPFNWVPWVAPGIIGVVGGRYWKNFYRRRFGDLKARATGVGAEA